MAVYYAPRKQHATVESTAQILIQFFSRGEQFPAHVFGHQTQAKVARKIWDLLTILKQRGSWNPIKGHQLADSLGEKSVSNLRSLIKETRKVVEKYGYHITSSRQHGYSLVITHR